MKKNFKNNELLYSLNDQFLQKFEGRYDKIGAGGIRDVKLNEFMIPDYFNKKKEKAEKEKENKANKKSMFSRMLNQYNAFNFQNLKNSGLMDNKGNIVNNKSKSVDEKINLNTEDENIYIINNTNNEKLEQNNKNMSDNKNNKESKNMNDNKNNYINKQKIEQKTKRDKIKKDKIEKDNINIPKNEYLYKINEVNNYPINKNDYIRNERFYKPYSLNEYKDIMNKYKQNKFGGLGKNLNKAWEEREKRFNKAKVFENLVVRNFNNKIHNNYKRLQSPQKVQMDKIGKEIISSKRYISQKYGKGLMLNKVRYKKEMDKIRTEKMKEIKDKEKFLNNYTTERKHKDNDIFKNYDNIINPAYEEYIGKIMELKSTLI